MERIDEIAGHLSATFARIGPAVGIGPLGPDAIYVLRAAVIELIADGVIT